MNTFDGYIRRDGTNSKVLLDGGDAKALSSFIGTLSYNNNKITYTKADGSTSYDLVTLEPNITSTFFVGNLTDSSTTTTALTDGNVYLHFKEGDSESKFKISGLQNIIVTTDASGNIIITGPDLSGLAVSENLNNYLPLTGGVLLSNSQNTPLHIKSYNGVNSYIGFLSNTGSYLGYYGFENSVPKVYIGETNGYTVLHSGNSNISNGVITINGSTITPITSLSGYATEQFVTNKLSSILEIKIVTSLPTSDINKKAIYLMSASNSETNNLYREHVYINKGTEANPNWDWEILGEVKLNYSDLVTSIGISNLQLTWSKGGVALTAIDIDAKRLLGRDLNSIYGGISYVETDGVMKIGKYIDFHNSSDDSRDYAVRLLVDNAEGSYTLILQAKAGTVALTSDISDYTYDKTTSDDRYVNVTGDTMTGRLVNMGAVTGATEINFDCDAIVIAPKATRNGTAGMYYPGLAFNHMWNYNGGTGYNNSAQGWIGLRLVDTPGSERSSLVFATKPGTGTSNTGNDRPIERMCIAPDGNVGIGTSSPTQKLHIDGNEYITGYINFNDRGYIRSNNASSFNYSYTFNDSSYNLLGDSTNSIGIFSGPVGEEGAIIVSPDTCVIYNSSDTGWNFAVHDKDLGGNLIENVYSSDNSFPDEWGSSTRTFGIRQTSYVAYSRGGFEKKGSSDSYVLLGGGGHKLISDFSLSGHSHNYLPLSGGTMILGEGLKFHSDNNYFGTDADARIISLLDSNDTICDGGLIIDERGTLNGTEYVTELLRIRDNEFKWKGSTILTESNISSYAITSHQSLSGYLPLSGGTIINGGDICFGTPSNSNDSGDIVFLYGNGQEKSRIWTDNTYTTAIGPNYRVYSSDGTLLISTTLALEGHTHSYLPLSGGTMTGGNISWNSDSHGIYFYGSCGIEKWSGYGPALVAEGNNLNFWIRNGTDRSDCALIIHSGNIGNLSVNYATSAGNADTVDGYHFSDLESRYVNVTGDTMTGDLHVYAHTYCGYGTGSPIIDYNVYAMYVGTNGTRTSTAGSYIGGIAFSHMIKYSEGYTYVNSPQGWIGLRIVDYPGSERSSLVFATKSGTNISNTGDDIPQERMCITPEGNVGIGTTSPSYKLDVNGGFRAGLIEIPSGQNIINAISGYDLFLNFGNTSNVLFAGGGNVGIGTTSPSYKLDVNGNIHGSHFYMDGYLYMPFEGSFLSTIDNDGNGPIFGYALALNNRRVYYTGSPVYICGGSYGNYASGITVNSSNNVGIGTTSPGSKLEVSGNVTATAFYASSDLRLKNIITRPNYSAEQLASLPLVKYTWKDKENDSIHLGSIAQNVEEDFAELVNTDDKGYKSLDYATLGTIGVISLAREIVELKKEIKELKSKLYG